MFHFHVKFIQIYTNQPDWRCSIKILITGATGFVGTNIIIQLHKKYKFTALVRSSSNTETIKNLCTLYTYPHSGGIQELVQYCKNEKFDGVIHLATFYLQSTKEDYSFSESEKIYQSNLDFGRQILEVLKHYPPSFFINTTTFSQYANSTKYNPLTLYDATKQAFCDIMQFYASKMPTTFCNLLLYNTYGPNDNRPKIFNLWKKIAQTQEVLEMSGGEQKIDISHIDDIVCGFQTLIELCKNKKVRTLSTFTLENHRHTLKELAKIFETATNSSLPIIWGARPYRENEIMNPISSKNSSLQKLPNWKPKILLEQGIKDVYGISQ